MNCKLLLDYFSVHSEQDSLFRKYLLRMVIVCMMTCFLIPLSATKLVEVKVVDKDYLMIHFKDGDVTFVDDGFGDGAYGGHEHNAANNEVVTYGSALNTSNAVNTSNWSLFSSADGNYSGGKNPVSANRKSKMNGMAEFAWSGSDYQYEYTHQHWIYLKLPHSLEQGKSYSLNINSNTNTDQTSVSFTYNIFESKSEAIKINSVGYTTADAIKAADLYLWMGDAGARDYSSFEGNKVYVYDVDAGTSQEVGTVSFWKSGGSDVFGRNLTQSDIWTADFTGFNTPGTYRLAIEGVGSSDEFEIKSDIYYDPYKVSVKGFFYMRIGQDNLDMTPVPRRPLWIPDVDPSDCKVVLTNLNPYHPDWENSGGDTWDEPGFFANYVKSGSPTNPDAIGGHSDALDWDRHLGHVSIIYDMLLPYILSGGALSDDNLGIAESGNGIPDIIDEARNEVDFFLSLRDGDGYGHGLSNPDESTHILYQAAPSAVAAWANAANAAMLAEAYRLAGNTTLMNKYKDAAGTAYNYANGLSDKQLDVTQNIGECEMRGRDFKLTAAAYLYNVTGNTVYEDAIKQESVVTGNNTDVISKDNYNQLWATAAYLNTNRTVNYATLYNNMKSSVISTAKSKEANNINSRPSRRATDNNAGYFQTVQNVHRTIVAHAVTDNSSDKQLFENALTLEADWSLGRNPLNIIQMTTATTSLADNKSIENIYTSGRDDGAEGMHPGHTPYLNMDCWFGGMTMGCPTNLSAHNYPSSNWPFAEHYYNTRYVWAHSEFTPQQTMRGKMALYGYLYSLGSTAPPPPVEYYLEVKNGSGDGNYTEGSVINVLADDPANGEQFDKWTGDVSYLENANSSNTTLSMPAQAVTITATYVGETTYTLTVSNGSGDGEYTQNSVVDIGADDAPAGQQFASWTGDVGYLNDAGNSNTFVTMPASNVSVTATYENIPETENCGQIQNYSFESGMTNWINNGNSTTDSDAYTGSKALITGTGEGGVHYENLIHVGTNTEYSFTVYAKTISSPSWAGIGLDFLDGSGNEVGEDVMSSFSSSYREESLQGSIPSGTEKIRVWTWKSGSNGTLVMDDVCLNLSGSVEPTYTLTVTNGSGDGEYTEGTTVDITADAAPSGQQFAGWTGDAGNVSDVSSPATTVTMPAYSVSITATYEDIPSSGLDIPGKIEAEDYSSMSGIQTQATSDDGGGDNIGWVDSGDWMDYEVNVANAGDYVVAFRIASKSNGTKFDLKQGSNVFTSVSEPATGGWQTWTTVTKTVNLAEGVQTIRVLATGGGWNMNWMEFTESTGTVPQDPMTFQAENATLTGTNVSTNWPGYDGAGYVDGLDNTGDKISWTVNGIDAGTYDITIRYSICNDQKNYVQINGSGWDGSADGSTDFVDNNTSGCGNSDDWETMTLTDVNLNADNTIEIVKQWGYTPIDYIKLSAPKSGSIKQQKQNQSLMSFTVYPNPVKNGSFYVDVTQGTDIAIQIYTVQGSLVYQTMTNGQSSIEINKQLDGGIYFIKAGDKIRKLMVQ